MRKDFVLHVSILVRAMIFISKAAVNSLHCLHLRRRISFGVKHFSMRQPSNELTLDTNLISTKPELVASHLLSRKVDDLLVRRTLKIGDLRTERNALIMKRDHAKGLRKTLSKDIGLLLKAKNDAEVEKLKAKVDQCNREADAADEKLAKIEEEINDILFVVPNLLDDRVPDGANETDNVIVHTWGDDLRKVGNNFLWHDELAKHLNGIDTEAAARMSGSRFSVLVGPVARLERALSQYFLDFHTSRGYTEVSVPFIVSRSTLQGTGQLPKFEEDLFKVNHIMGGEDAFLIPTAEVPVTNLFRDQIINSSDLPIRIVCSSPSFRAEAGSYGRDTRGLLRQHQFQKVELVRICTPETSAAEHEALVGDAEALLKSLNLPYRRVLLCSADTGFSARICYDLEVWLPGQQEYREISSCSNCYEFQSRRMSLRYHNTAQNTSTPVAVTRDQDKSKSPNVQQGHQRKNLHPHTLNGSGLAVGRALVAVLENYQREDGSVELPEVLWPYMGGLKVLEPVNPGHSGHIKSIYSLKNKLT